MATRTIHKLQLPYAAPEWPPISREHEGNIVRHLVQLLNPIGDHRRSHVIPSKGRRRKKRKLDDKDQANDSAEHSQLQMPAVSESLKIGFNSTVRSLEAMSKRSRPVALKEPKNDIEELETDNCDLAVVFICRSVLPDRITASIPILIATASLARPENPPIRLIQLSADADSQLAEALHQPRVGFVGVGIGTPGADILFAVTRAAAGPIRVPWLDSSEAPRYWPVQIESSETSAGSKEKKPSRPSGLTKQPQLKGRPPKIAAQS